jgi:transcriptional regulator of arginine metabolism
MSDRERRRRHIGALLARGPVPSQERLVELLAERGVRATQATLSRDLREMGVVKGAEGYAIPETPAAVERGDGELRQALRDYALEASTGGTLVVLKTGPGHAQILGLALDRAPLDGVLGTVAGDDTVFVAARSAAAAKELLGRLTEMAGLK